MSGALHARLIAPVVTTTSIILKRRLTAANPGSSGKRPLKQREREIGARDINSEWKTGPDPDTDRQMLFRDTEADRAAAAAE